MVWKCHIRSSLLWEWKFTGVTDLNLIFFEIPMKEGRELRGQALVVGLVDIFVYKVIPCLHPSHSSLVLTTHSTTPPGKGEIDFLRESQR